LIELMFFSLALTSPDLRRVRKVTSDQQAAPIQLLAQSGHFDTEFQCPLLGVNGHHIGSAECLLLTLSGPASSTGRQIRPGDETLCFQGGTHCGACTNAFAVASDACIGRQIEVYPTSPIRHDEEVGISNGVIGTHKIFIAFEMLIEMGKSCLKPRTKDLFSFFGYAFVEQW
jgi:hypothetical protein